MKVSYTWPHSKGAEKEVSDRQLLILCWLLQYTIRVVKPVNYILASSANLLVISLRNAFSSPSFSCQTLWEHQAHGWQPAPVSLSVSNGVDETHRCAVCILYLEFRQSEATDMFKLHPHTIDIVRSNKSKSVCHGLKMMSPCWHVQDPSVTRTHITAENSFSQ